MSEDTSIGNFAFDLCRSLASITIPNSVTSIVDLAFYDCESLVSISIPNSVTSISVGTFEGCTSLKSITIPDSVKSIGVSAFNSCTSLKSITIPDIRANSRARSRLSSFISSRRIRQFTTLSTAISPIRSSFDLTVL